MVSAIAIASLVAATLIGALASLFLKFGAEKFSLSIKGILKNRFFILGIFCYGVSTLIYLSVLRLLDLSITYPLVAMQYIWISLLSVKYLKEKMNMLKWAGIGLIILGAAFISMG
jgi:drug/metabolite transporter (DMT)-like permease